MTLPQPLCKAQTAAKPFCKAHTAAKPLQGQKPVPCNKNFNLTQHLGQNIAHPESAVCVAFVTCSNCFFVVLVGFSHQFPFSFLAKAHLYRALLQGQTPALPKLQSKLSPFARPSSALLQGQVQPCAGSIFAKPL